MKKITIILLLILLSAPFMAAQETNEETPFYACDLSLYDSPNDEGVNVELEFTPGNTAAEVPQYAIDLYIDGAFSNTIMVKNAGALFLHTIPVDKSGTLVRAEVFAYDAQGQRQGPIVVKEATSAAQWYFSDRLGAFIWSLAFIGLIMVLIRKAKRGQEIFIRRIAGLEAIDDAVGRATEMGRPVYYIPGTSVIDDIATLASLNILRPVAQQVATYETPFSVPIQDPVVLTVAQDVVKEAYMAAGRADLHDEGMVYLASVGQFAYAAAVNGAMVLAVSASMKNPPQSFCWECSGLSLSCSQKRLIPWERSRSPERTPHLSCPSLLPPATILSSEKNSMRHPLISAGNLCFWGLSKPRILSKEP